MCQPVTVQGPSLSPVEHPAPQVHTSEHTTNVDPATATHDQMVQLSDGSFKVVCAHCKVAFTYPKPSREGVKLQSAQRCLDGFKRKHGTCQPVLVQGPSPSPVEHPAPQVSIL